MRWALILIPAALLAQAIQPSLAGSWINENSATPGLTQIAVRYDGGRMRVHAWGACHPTDCDWGEVDGEAWQGIPTAIWKHGFSTVSVQLIPQPGGGMLAAYRSEYHDGSGRKEGGTAEFFAREGTHPEGDVAAKAVLHQVAEAYRNLPNCQLGWTETVTRLSDKSEARTVRHVVLLYAPPDRSRVESSGSGAKTIVIRDGKSEWLTYPDTSEYVVTPQGKLAIPEPIRRYSLLDTGRATPRTVGPERLDGVDCTVVELSMERGVTAKLWIDKATHMVRKETSDEPSSRKREIVFTEPRRDPSISPDAFIYNPATQRARDRSQLAREAPKTLSGGPAPNFALRDLDGNEVRLSDLRGKVVLLDFWGSWCGPCRDAMPTMELLHRSLRDKGLVVYGVDSEEPAIAREYLRKNGYTMASLTDTREEVVSAYRILGWPTTIVIDREGKVTYYETGHDPQKLRDALRALGVW